MGMTKRPDLRKRFRIESSKYEREVRAHGFWKRLAIKALLADLIFVTFACWQGYCQVQLDALAQQQEARIKADTAIIGNLATEASRWEARYRREHRRALANRDMAFDCQKELANTERRP